MLDETCPMQLLASQIKNLPLASSATQSKVGKILNPIFDPESGKVLGLVVSVSILGKSKVVSISDVISWDKTAVIIPDEDVILDQEEVIKINEVIKSKITILGQKARTENSQNLGRVSDVLIDTATLSISKFYLKNILADRILPAHFVSKITPQAVIFKDAVLNSKAKSKIEREEVESMEPELA